MIDFKITTPEKIFLEEKVESLSLPTQMGEITVLPNHIPMVANLTHGEIRYSMQGKEYFFAVSGGFIDIQPDNKVVVLADTAEFGHEIDLERAEKAREAALKLMQDSRSDQKTLAQAAAIIEKNLARVRVARKHRSRTHQRPES